MDINEKIFELALPYLKTRNNDIHTSISKQCAEFLLTKEPGDPEIVVPAIILHDVGWSKISEELQVKAFGPGNWDKKLNRVHEVEGMKIAKDILLRIGYNPSKAHEIITIIEGHDSRPNPLSPSDKLVKDADKLFRLTSEGRTFYLQKFDINENELYQHFRGSVEDWFFTDTAKEAAYAELRKKHWQNANKN